MKRYKSDTSESMMRHAYAKINLGLDVIRKREDGYHEVKMIMQTVSLCDKVTLTMNDSGIITIDTNLSFLPANENNLAYQAVALLKEAFQIKKGIHIHLEKHIPVAAGMAGGSTDCATAMLIMNQLFHLGLTKKQLMEYGVTLGADVPYCIMGGTALSEGIGEKLTALPPAPKCKILIVKPDIHVSTRFVYENLNANGLTHHPDIDGMAEAIRANDLAGVTSRMENVLETVTEKNYPVISEIKETLLSYGAVNSLMSGSGPTVFGVFSDNKTVKNAYTLCRNKYTQFKVFTADLIRAEERRPYGRTKRNNG